MNITVKVIQNIIKWRQNHPHKTNELLYMKKTYIGNNLVEELKSRMDAASKNNNN